MDGDDRGCQQGMSHPGMWAAPQCKEQQEPPVALAGLPGSPDATDHLQWQVCWTPHLCRRTFFIFRKLFSWLQNTSGYESMTVLWLAICIPGKNTWFCHFSKTNESKFWGFGFLVQMNRKMQTAFKPSKNTGSHSHFPEMLKSGECCLCCFTAKQ